VSSARKRLRTIALVLALLLSIPAVYILAIGPLIFYYETVNPKGTTFGHTVETVYAPFGPFIADSRSAGARALRLYINLWSKNDLPEPDDLVFPSGL
jgi:hypothetical protein